jgi:hypothetical protein
VLSILHVEICPHSTHPIHSITKELKKAMEGQKRHWDFVWSTTSIDNKFLPRSSGLHCSFFKNGPLK